MQPKFIPVQYTCMSAITNATEIFCGDCIKSIIRGGGSNDMETNSINGNYILYDFMYAWKN